MSVARTYLRSASMLTALAVLQRGLGFLTTAAMARGLGPAGLGIYNTVTTTAASGFAVIRLGADGALHISTAEGGDSVRRGRLFGAALVLLGGGGLVGGCAVFLLAGVLAQSVFGQPEVAPWLRASAVLLVAQALNQFAYVGLVGLHEFRRYTVATAILAGVNTALVMVGVWLGGLRGAVSATVASSLFTVAVLGWSLRASLRGARVAVSFEDSGRSMRDLLMLGFPLYAAGLVSVPVAYALQGLLVRSAGIGELGFLRVTTSLSSLVSFIPSSIAGATISSLAAARTSDDGDRKYLEHASANLRVIWLGSTLMVLVASAALPWAVPTFFGEAYRPAVFATAVALLGAVMTALDAVGHQVLFSGRRTRALTAVMVLRPAVFGIVGFTLVRHHGLVGYLTAECVSAGASFGLMLALFERRARDVAPGLIHTRPTIATGALFGLTAVAIAAMMRNPAVTPAQTGGILGLLAVLVGGAGARVSLTSDEQAAVSRLARRFWPPHTRASF